MDKIAKQLNSLSIRIEQKIRKKEKLISQLNYTQELTKIGSWILDRETNKMEWSNEVYSILGEQPDANENRSNPFLRQYILAIDR